MGNTGICTIYIFSYMSGSKCLWLLMFILCSVGSCSPGSVDSSLKSEGYSVQFDDSPLNEKWGHYLYKHLSRRIQDGKMVLLHKTKKNFLNIKVGIDPGQSHDYRIVSKGNKQLTLTARNEKTMLWLIYQFIERLSGEDDHIIADDLPPSVVTFENTEADFDFAYRDPHFYSNLEDSEYAPVIGANNVDNDWGIWGHNLGKVVSADAGNNIYAKQKGKINKEQYCFSNEEIYRRIEEYIVDNFGDSREYTQRFMIMPNDNDVVCDCGKCIANGNTQKNATPALSILINRLASRFPHHQFFTSAYLTTLTSPKHMWNENTGVMISTIDIPKGVTLGNQREVEQFLQTLSKWRTKVLSVYIWDYAANFDDYLTPAPVLYGLKKQLTFYKSKGVKGVFLNANGYDYASFDDMKTFVAANLMINVNLSVDSLCRAFLLKLYPQTGSVLADYYLSLEQTFASKECPYNMYAGFDEIMNTYLDADHFIAFYNLLKSEMSKAGEREKLKLKKLFTALTFTRLQIAYQQISGIYGFADMQGKELIVRPEVKIMLDELSGYEQFDNFLNYKETDGALELYVAGWNNLLKKLPENKLAGESVAVLSGGSETGMINRLYDGVGGFAENYHQGWFINNKDLHIRFDGEAAKDAKKITINFLVDKKHRIYTPDKIMLFKNEEVYMEIIPEIANDNKPQVVKTEMDVDFSDADKIDVQVINKGKGSFACDEIWIN